MTNILKLLSIRLNPYKKVLIVGTILGFIAVPLSILAMIGLNNPSIMLVGLPLCLMAFMWCWGLYLIAIWYTPQGGLDDAKAKFPQAFGHLIAFIAPLLLFLWFIFPIIATIFVMQLFEGMRAGLG